jgi:hypothetical protein
MKVFVLSSKNIILKLHLKISIMAGTKINEVIYQADEGQNWTRELQPPQGKKFYSIEIDGVPQALQNEYFHTVTLNNVTAAQTIKVCLVDAPSALQYLVTIITGAGGASSNYPNSPVFVNEGSSLEINIVPFQGFQINQVLVDGINETITNPLAHTVNLSNITSDREIIATFKAL